MVVVVAVAIVGEVVVASEDFKVVEEEDIPEYLTAGSSVVPILTSSSESVNRVSSP